MGEVVAAIVCSHAPGITAFPAPEAQRDAVWDGFVGVPSAALAFQWWTVARYITDLRTSFLTGCVLVANRAFDRVPVDARPLSSLQDRQSRAPDDGTAAARLSPDPDEGAPARSLVAHA